MRPSTKHGKLACVVLTSAIICSGCHRKAEPNKTTPVHRNARRLAALQAAELDRDTRKFTVDDLTSRDVEVRRRAMQGLSRIGDAASRSAFEHGLADEDGQVVAWAAFGIGRTCDKDAETAVAQLALRATSWSVSEHEATASGRFTIDPLAAIADAMGHCATPIAETTLANWLRLGLPLAERAALALGSIAAKQHRLENTTLVALLDMADPKQNAPDSTLYPLTRLTSIETNVQKRLLAVAGKTLTNKTDARYYAVRCLPLAGDAAIPVLARIVVDAASYEPELRADAVRGLARLTEGGQLALGKSLVRLIPKLAELNATWLESAGFGPIAEVLDELNHVDAELRPMLEGLSRMPLPAATATAAYRRSVLLRCQASALLARDNVAASALRACDPNKNGRTGDLALLRVLGQDSIRGHRAAIYDRLATATDPVVRETALRLMRVHPEVHNSAHYLANALTSDSAGVVATAASIIAENPERAQDKPERASASTRGFDRTTPAVNPTPEVLLALDKATHREWEADAIDVRLQLADAVSALGALGAKPFLEELCRAGLGVLRRHSELALHRLGDVKRRCPAPAPIARKHATIDAESDVHVRLQTDVGPLEMWFEPTLAPATVARVVELIKSGFFDNMPVHRVVPGFVIQMGDRAGDEYGGTGEEPLRDELAPIAFPLF